MAPGYADVEENKWYKGVAPGCAHGEEDIVEGSGSRMRRCGGGKEIVERSGTRMRRCGVGKEIVERSGTRMRRSGGGKEIGETSRVGLFSRHNGRETQYHSCVVRYNCELQIHTLTI